MELCGLVIDTLLYTSDIRYQSGWTVMRAAGGMRLLAKLQSPTYTNTHVGYLLLNFGLFFFLLLMNSKSSELRTVHLPLQAGNNLFFGKLPKNIISGSTAN